MRYGMTFDRGKMQGMFYENSAVFEIICRPCPAYRTILFYWPSVLLGLF